VTEQSGGRSALDAAIPALRCPHCAGPLRRAGDELRCGRGHSFDIARQGYVSFAVGRIRGASPDTASMVAARARFLNREHYAPIADALGSVAAKLAQDAAGDGMVLDLAGGTGYYLSAVLRHVPDRIGVCVELSKAALRRAAAVHPRAAAIGADVWQALPVADRSAALVLSVFGPRNSAETNRVLTRGGAFIVVTPTPRHLGEVIAPLGMLTVDAAKADRLAANTSGLEQTSSRTLEYPVAMPHPDLSDLVAMGPSAYHVQPAQLAERLGALADPLTVTVSVTVSAYRAGGG
jgi:23S rRNA (guanine745-N1)-methyltransferase